MELERRESIDYTVGRYITYEGMNEPTLWLAPRRDMELTGARRMAAGRNKEMEHGRRGPSDSPDSPFFVVKIRLYEILERVDDKNKLA